MKGKIKKSKTPYHLGKPKKSKYTGKTTKDPLVKDMRTARNAQRLGRDFAEGSRTGAKKTKRQRKARLTEGKLAAKNLISAAKARGRLKAGKSK